MIHTFKGIIFQVYAILSSNCPIILFPTIQPKSLNWLVKPPSGYPGCRKAKKAVVICTRKLMKQSRSPYNHTKPPFYLLKSSYKVIMCNQAQQIIRQFVVHTLKIYQANGVHCGASVSELYRVFIGNMVHTYCTFVMYICTLHNRVFMHLQSGYSTQPYLSLLR